MNDLRLLDVYFQQEAYQAGLDHLEQLPPPVNSSEQAERRRAKGWLSLALGKTEQAYHLFWLCADHPGGRAGLLILTVLAGQVEAAIANWNRYCARTTKPLERLPDATWHARPVAQAALKILENYPFQEFLSVRAASDLYRALLYRALGLHSSAFLAISASAEHLPLAALTRDRWLEQVACLPAPETGRSPEADRYLSPRVEPPGSAVEAVNSASRILLYYDIQRLESDAESALNRGHWVEALELLRRCLFLQPDHTPSLERRWRLHIKLQQPEAAQSDLFALVDLYESTGQIAACLRAATDMVETFPNNERALLKMCFLQSRLRAPIALAHFGRRLLALCQQQALHERHTSYRLWLLRQELTLDDRREFDAKRSA